jgi:hypothetical protein
MNTNRTETTTHETASRSSAQEVKTHTCCAGAAPAGMNACCVLDAEAKSAGDSGCGCGSVTSTPALDQCLSRRG